MTLLEDLVETANLENEQTEFKARLEIGVDRNNEDKAARWLKEIVAFANSNGGRLYVGVNDKSHELEPLTHQEFDQQVNLLYDQLKSRVEPEIQVQINELPVPESKPVRYIMQVAVPPSPTTPVFLHVSGVPIAYLRRFGRSVTASAEQIVNLAIKGEKLHFDELSTNERFSFDVFSSFKQRYEDINEQLLTEKALKSNLLVDDKGFFTRGGLLFKDGSDSPLSLVKITQYQGITRGSSLIKNAFEKTGDLASVIYESVDYIQNHTNVGFLKTNDSRIDVSAYPRRSLIEGLVNAYAHRNYFIDGAQISVDIFLDRLEITSPGSLLGGKFLKKEKDFSIIDPKRRNQTICNGFTLLRMMEAKGSGLSKIAEDYQGQDESHSPYIDCDGETFRLTLPDLTYRGGVLDEDNENPEIEWVDGSVTPYDKQVLSHCYMQPKSLADIASYLGLTPSTHLRKDILGILVDKGYLRQFKRGYSFYYQSVHDKVPLLGSVQFRYVEK